MCPEAEHFEMPGSPSSGSVVPWWSQTSTRAAASSRSVRIVAKLAPFGAFRNTRACHSPFLCLRISLLGIEGIQPTGDGVVRTVQERPVVLLDHADAGLHDAGQFEHRDP